MYCTDHHIISTAIWSFFFSYSSNCFVYYGVYVVYIPPTWTYNNNKKNRIWYRNWCCLLLQCVYVVNMCIARIGNCKSGIYITNLKLRSPHAIELRVDFSKKKKKNNKDSRSMLNNSGRIDFLNEMREIFCFIFFLLRYEDGCPMYLMQSSWWWWWCVNNVALNSILMKTFPIMDLIWFNLFVLCMHTHLHEQTKTILNWDEHFHEVD